MKRPSTSWTSSSAEETETLGKNFGTGLAEKSVLALFGGLGSGKTTFVKGLVEGFAKVSKNEATSPTFSYLHIYSGGKIIYHFDLYRLKNESEFLSMGFLEMLEEPDLCCIEWPERIASLLPPHTVSLFFEHISPQTRAIKNEKSPISKGAFC